jgi:hypothetical protein
VYHSQLARDLRRPNAINCQLLEAREVEARLAAGQ